MKCSHCGGTVSLEDERCPHCGQLNEHAQKHIEDMRRYKGEFEHTKKHVYERTRLFTQVTVRVIVLAVLVILAVGLYLLEDNAYAIRRIIQTSSAERKYDQYSEELDQYLADENFRAFCNFCYAHGLSAYEGRYAGKYGCAIWVCYNYDNLYNSLMEYAFPKSYTTIQQAQRTAECMGFFYNTLDYEPGYGIEDENDPAVAKAIETMKENVERFLVAYCGFTKEEAESMQELSDVRRAVILEEKLEGRLQDGE